MPLVKKEPVSVGERKTYLFSLVYSVDIAEFDNFPV